MLHGQDGEREINQSMAIASGPVGPVLAGPIFGSS